MFLPSLISVYAVSLVLAHPPASTTHLQVYGTDNGWSPRPTTNPNDHPLARRQLDDDSVCGYVGGIRTSSVTCPDLRSCFFNTRLSAAGCCYSATDSPVECGQYTSCVPRSEAARCTGACASDPLVAICTGILNPECFTYEFPGYKNIGCAPTAGAESAEFTYIGQRTAAGFSSRVQTAAASATADDTDDEDSKPSFTFGLTRSTSTSSSSSEDDDGDDSSSSVSYSSGRRGRKGRKSSGSGGGKKGGKGGIIGGAVAALIIISTIVSLILFCIKKRKEQKQGQQPQAAVYQQQQQFQPQASQVSQVPLQQYQQPAPQYPAAPQPAYYDHSQQMQQPMKAEYSGGQAQGYYQQPMQPAYPAHGHQ